MAAGQLLHAARNAPEPDVEAERSASIVSRLASRLRPTRGEARMRTECGDPQQDCDLLQFARGQIESRPPIEGVDLAHPLSISTDAAAGAVRAEFAYTPATSDRGQALLDEVVASIAPALFADGRIARVDVGLVPAVTPDDRSTPPAATTQWAIARPGYEHAC